MVIAFNDEKASVYSSVQKQRRIWRSHNQLWNWHSRDNASSSSKEMNISGWKSNFRIFVDLRISSYDNNSNNNNNNKTSEKAELKVSHSFHQLRYSSPRWMSDVDLRMLRYSDTHILASLSPKRQGYGKQDISIFSSRVDEWKWHHDEKSQNYPMVLNLWVNMYSRRALLSANIDLDFIPEIL